MHLPAHPCARVHKLKTLLPKSLLSVCIQCGGIASDGTVTAFQALTC